MATYHQAKARRRNGFTAYDATRYTVWDDRPGEPASAMLFATREAAQGYIDRRSALGTGAGLFIVEPQHKEA